MKERPILFSSQARWIRVAASRMGMDPEYYALELNAGRKPCGGCRRSLAKTSENFGKESKKYDGLKSRCRECVSLSKKERYARVRPQERIRRLAYQRANRAKLYAYNAAWQRQYRSAIRAEMIVAFGGGCECCGESQPFFLDLDHVNGDGKECRAEHGGNSLTEMKSLKDKGWPKDGYRLLCCNCHQGRHRNGGICPHKAGDL
jgi:hypothetical protein